VKDRRAAMELHVIIAPVVNKHECPNFSDGAFVFIAYNFYDSGCDSDYALLV